MGDSASLPLWGAMETTFHSSEKLKILTKDAWGNFDNAGQNYFSYLEEQSQKNQKSFVKGGPPINPSLINTYRIP